MLCDSYIAIKNAMNFSLPSLIRCTACLRTTLLGLAACGGIVLHAQDTNAATAATSAPAGSLVSNGDFSLATQDPTWPDSWGKAAGITWEAEGGKHFLRLTAQAPDKLLMAYREINIPAGVKNITISIRYRTSGIATGAQNWMDARAIFHFLDADRKPVKPDPKLLDFSKNAADWTVTSEQSAIPDGATKLVLMPSLFKVAAGTLDLAEITVTPTP